MAEWEEVQSAARAAYVLDRDETHEFAVTLPVGGGRAQRVMVRRFDALDTVMVELRSAFAEQDELTPAQVLDDNLDLALGALARHGRYYVVVHKVALEHSTVRAVLFYMTRIARIADSLEEQQGQDRF